MKGLLIKDYYLLLQQKTFYFLMICMVISCDIAVKTQPLPSPSSCLYSPFFPAIQSAMTNTTRDIHSCSHCPSQSRYMSKKSMFSAF